MGVRQQPRKFYRELCGQLIRFAEFQFRLNKQVKDKDGRSTGSRREWLSRYAKDNPGYTADQIGKVLSAVRCPPALSHVYGWFIELANMRDYGEAGPKSIKPSEIAAWSDLTRRRPSPLEIRIILDLDVRFRNIHAEDEATDLTEHDRAVLAYVEAATLSKSWG